MANPQGGMPLQVTVYIDENGQILVTNSGFLDITANEMLADLQAIQDEAQDLGDLLHRPAEGEDEDGELESYYEGSEEGEEDDEGDQAEDDEDVEMNDAGEGVGAENAGEGDGGEVRATTEDVEMDNADAASTRSRISQWTRDARHRGRLWAQSSYESLRRLPGRVRSAFHDPR